MNFIENRYTLLVLSLLIVVWAVFVGCAATTTTPSEARRISGLSKTAPGGADDFTIVSCLLPGKIRQLGSRMVYLTRRKAVKATAKECAVRGGEFALPDQSDLTQALMVWMPNAESGDPEAQYYVGEIFQRGLGSDPQYDRAVHWYRKSADQGYAKAQMNLAYLYEKGLGVKKDPREAERWYRRATGLGDAITLDQNTLSFDERKELQELREEVSRRDKETKALRQKLKDIHRDLDGTRRKLTQYNGGKQLQDRKMDELKALISFNEETIRELRSELAQKEAIAKDSSAPREDKQTGILKQQLGTARRDLEKARRQLNRHLSETQAHQHEVDKLASQALRYEETIKQMRLELAKTEEIVKHLPAPRIEIYDSPPPSTRGIIAVKQHQKRKKKRLIAGVVWAPAGLASFKVNQKTEQVGPDGKFTVPVSVGSSGDIIIEFEAVDKRGRQTHVSHSLIRSATKPTFNQEPEGMEAIDFGRYHALIIGNINYRKLPRLHTAANDARTVANVLRDKYGFETKLLIDANRYDIIHALDQFRKTLTEKDNLLIYYAGHGFLDTKNNRGYWQPVDAEMDSSANWIPDYTITDQLNIMAVKKVLVIADSCYSGALTRSAMARLESAQSPEVRRQYIRQLAKGRTRMVLSSGELAPVLDFGGGKHSVFANVLLDVLESNERIIEGNRLYQEMSARVVYDSKRFGLTQVPLYATNIQAGHASGDFIFVPRKQTGARQQ